MRIRLTLVGAVLAVLALAFSCKTPPPAVEPEPEVPTVEVAPEPEAEPTDVGAGAPTELKAKAAELRKTAFDLGLKDLMPAEYGEAESAYLLGAEKYGKDNAASTAAFEDAVARFEALLKAGLPLVAAKEGEKAWNMQAAAMDKGATDYFGDLYSSATGDLFKAGELEQSGDYEAAIRGYRLASARFNAIMLMCDAAVERDGIVERDFAQWDTSNWNLAEAKLASAGDLLESDAAASRAAADEALLRYRQVMRNAFLLYAGDRKTLSESERERAVGIKSEVAAKDEFESAVALYESAEAFEEAEDYESASSLYQQAADAFVDAHDTALDKMYAAQDELYSLDEALDAAANR